MVAYLYSVKGADVDAMQNQVLERMSQALTEVCDEWVKEGKISEDIKQMTLKEFMEDAKNGSILATLFG